MADDKKNREGYETPHRGIKARPDSASEWTGDTAVHAITERNDVREVASAVDLDTDDKRMQRRVKETNAAVAAANTGITTLRMETKSHIDRVGSHLTVQDARIGKLDEKVEKIDGNLGQATQKIDQLGGDVGELRTDVGKLDAHMTHVRSTVDNLVPTLLKTLTDDRAARRADDHEVLTAQVSVSRHQQITTIDDDADVKRKQREAEADAERKQREAEADAERQQREDEADVKRRRREFKYKLALGALTLLTPLVLAAEHC
jgi:chromosome segregation ATPase